MSAGITCVASSGASAISSEKSKLSSGPCTPKRIAAGAQKLRLRDPFPVEKGSVGATHVEDPEAVILTSDFATTHRNADVLRTVNDHVVIRTSSHGCAVFGNLITGLDLCTLSRNQPRIALRGHHKMIPRSASLCKPRVIHLEDLLKRLPDSLGNLSRSFGGAYCYVLAAFGSTFNDVSCPFDGMQGNDIASALARAFGDMTGTLRCSNAHSARAAANLRAGPGEACCAARLSD